MTKANHTQRDRQRLGNQRQDDWVHRGMTAIAIFDLIIGPTGKLRKAVTVAEGILAGLEDFQHR